VDGGAKGMRPLTDSRLDRGVARGPSPGQA
jgi:hypothetical protein